MQHLVLPLLSAHSSYSWLIWGVENVPFLPLTVLLPLNVALRRDCLYWGRTESHWCLSWWKNEQRIWSKMHEIVGWVGIQLWTHFDEVFVFSNSHFLYFFDRSVLCKRKRFSTFSWPLKTLPPPCNNCGGCYLTNSYCSGLVFACPMHRSC